MWIIEDYGKWHSLNKMNEWEMCKLQCERVMRYPSCLDVKTQLVYVPL